MNRKLYLLVILAIIGSMLITACGTPTPTPTRTAAPTATSEPTEEATEEPTTEAASADETVEATEEPTAEEATEEPTAEEATEEPTAEEATEEPTTETGSVSAATEEPTAEEATEEPTAEPTVEEATEEPTAEEATEEPTAEPTVEEATEEPTAEEATEEPTAEPTVEEATEEPTVEEPTAAATEEPTAAPTEDTDRATRVQAARDTRATAVKSTAEARAAVAATEEPTAEEATEEPTAEEATAEPTAAEATAEPTTEAGGGAEGTDLTGTITSVCLVTDLGRINDGTFNQFAYEGMVRAAEEFNLDSNYIETVSQADYANNIQTCLDDGYDAVVTVGFLIADATRAAAEANPGVYFVGVDQFFADPLPNLAGIQFREDQSGYLAGVMAALMTESNVIAGVYGEEIPPVIKFRNGFEQGAKSVNPDITVLGVYIPSFLAPAEGAEAAEAFIAEGADVIFGAGGPTGSGGITRAAEQGVKVIGVDQDEFLTTFGNGETPGADMIITSAVKRVDQGVYDMIQALSGGGVLWPSGSLYLMDAAVNGVGFAEAHLAEVSEEVTAQVQAAFEGLASGEIQTGVDPVTGALLEE